MSIAKVESIPSSILINNVDAPTLSSSAACSDTLLWVDAKNFVEYHIMQPKDADATLEAVALSFSKGEPLTQSLGATLADWKKFTKMWIHRMALEGNTVIAVDSNNGKILGTFLNEDFCNEDPTELEAFLETVDGNWGPVMEIITELEESLMDKYSIPAEPTDRPAGQYFHMWMIGVTPESRGRGVGKNLFVQSCKLASARGYQLAFAECTGALSTHLFKKYLGAKVDAFADYSTYSGPDREAINDIPKWGLGHMGTSMMTIDLSSTDF